MKWTCTRRHQNQSGFVSGSALLQLKSIVRQGTFSLFLCLSFARMRGKCLRWYGETLHFNCRLRERRGLSSWSVACSLGLLVADSIKANHPQFTKAANWHSGLLDIGGLEAYLLLCLSSLHGSLTSSFTLTQRRYWHKLKCPKEEVTLA